MRQITAKSHYIEYKTSNYNKKVTAKHNLNMLTLSAMIKELKVYLNQEDELINKEITVAYVKQIKYLVGENNEVAYQARYTLTRKARKSWTDDIKTLIVKYEQSKFYLP